MNECLVFVVYDKEVDSVCNQLITACKQVSKYQDSGIGKDGKAGDDAVMDLSGGDAVE